MTESALLKIRVKLEALVSKRQIYVASGCMETRPYESIKDEIESLLKEFEEPKKPVSKVVLLEQNEGGKMPYWVVFDQTTGRPLWQCSIKEEAALVCARNGWEVVE